VITEHASDAPELDPAERAALFIAAHPDYFRTDDAGARFIRRYTGYVTAMAKDNADYVRYGQPGRVCPIKPPGRWFAIAYS
jgi:hypothetical protein